MGNLIANPATGETIAPVREHTAHDAIKAAERSRTAQAAWAQLAARERARRVRPLIDVITANAHRMATVIRDCTGKTLTDAWSTEVLPAAIMTRFYTSRAPKLLRPQRLPAGSPVFFNKRSRLYREPYGVVGIISPWNYPIGIPLHEVLAAILAGNGVLLKVATQVQPAGEFIAEMMDAIDLPPGLFGLLHIPGPIAGDALLDAGVNKLCFTGSTPVGKELAMKAAARLIPINLELGGNDPMIVLADAPVARAAAGAVWAGLSNAGQSCGAVERIYVVDEVYDEFVEQLRERVSSLTVGFDTRGDVDLGSLTTGHQRQTVEEQIQDARERGALETARSNSADGGIFHPAVVLENVGAGSSAVRDETFGPVLAVQRVASAEEAVSLANDSYHGLSASVWTRNSRVGRDIASRLESGAVTLNDHLLSHGMASTPWGGYKESGIGRSHGEMGILSMTQAKVVVEERLPWMKMNLWWQPNTPRVLAAVQNLLIVLHGKGIVRRVRALFCALPLVLRRVFGRE